MGRAEYLAAEREWRDHPAFPALVETFRRSTATPSHLAFLALTGLAARGFEVVQRGDR